MIAENFLIHGMYQPLIVPTCVYILAPYLSLSLHKMMPNFLPGEDLKTPHSSYIKHNHKLSPLPPKQNMFRNSPWVLLDFAYWKIAFWTRACDDGQQLSCNSNSCATFLRSATCSTPTNIHVQYTRTTVPTRGVGGEEGAHTKSPSIWIILPTNKCQTCITHRSHASYIHIHVCMHTHVSCMHTHASCMHTCMHTNTHMHHTHTDVANARSYSDTIIYFRAKKGNMNPPLSKHSLGLTAHV